MPCILSDDTEVFVLLGSVLDTNATCLVFGLQLPGMLTLSHCDTPSYPYGKGNATVLNII